jgi:hypothetical protein
MYSTTDPWLPFWTNSEFQWWWKILNTPKRQQSMSWSEIDLWYIKNAVKTAYKDLITNY